MRNVKQHHILELYTNASRQLSFTECRRGQAHQAGVEGTEGGLVDIHLHIHPQSSRRLVLSTLLGMKATQLSILTSSKSPPLKFCLLIC